MAGFWGRKWKIRDWQYQCGHCGLWTGGKFKGRRDVPLADVQALFAKIAGAPVEGGEAPALRHPEHTRYVESGQGEPYGGGTCPTCNAEIREERQDRLERMQRVMAAPDAGNEGEGGSEAG